MRGEGDYEVVLGLVRTRPVGSGRNNGIPARCRKTSPTAV